MIPDIGLQEIIERIIADTIYIAVGSGSQAPAAEDTGLQTEITRKIADVKTRTLQTGYFNVWFGSDEGNGYTWREAGVLDAPSGGNLYARNLFVTPIEKTDLKVVNVEFRITSQRV